MCEDFSTTGFTDPLRLNISITNFLKFFEVDVNTGIMKHLDYFQQEQTLIHFTKHTGRGILKIWIGCLVQTFSIGN